MASDAPTAEVIRLNAATALDPVPLLLNLLEQAKRGEIVMIMGCVIRPAGFDHELTAIASTHTDVTRTQARGALEFTHDALVEYLTP